LYQVSSGVRSTRNADGGIVLDINQGQVFRLNVVGAVIFDAIQRGTTDSRMIEEIVQQFHVSPRAAYTDVHEFLASLERLGLVSRAT
jgi:Coenzyme PQQ synthesis protein D (PqqD)